MGYRTQLRMISLRAGEIPLEGEPFYDADNMRIGFWDFKYGVMRYFRIPGEGENENYIPEHSWDGNTLSFRNPDGTWDAPVDLTGAGISNITSDFDPATSIMTFHFYVNRPDGSATVYNFGTNSLKGPAGDRGPAGSPPLISFSVNNSGELVFSASYGDMQATSASINTNGELIVTYDF